MTDWPTPDGGKPDDWNPDHWLAFVALSEGETYAEAAKLVGRQRGTISGWVQKWRARYGPDFLRSPRAGVIADEDRARGREQAALATQEKWSDLRLAASRSYGVTADHARALSLAVLRRHLDNPALVADLTVRDALDLGRLADLLAKRADVLADLSPAGTELDLNLRANVDLSGLEAQVEGSETQELLAAAGDVVRRFRLISGGDDVIDVDEATT